MFEDEYDLALAIINGMEARSVKGVYALSVLSLIPPDYLLYIGDFDGSK